MSLFRIRATRSIEAVRASAAEAEERAARATEALVEARRQAEEAERRAAAATARLDGFQRDRLVQARAAAEATKTAALEAERRRPLWHRVFRRRG